MLVVPWVGSGSSGSRGCRERQGPHQADCFDVAAAHAVDVAITRGLPILTAEPDPLRALDPDVEIEELPAP